MPSFLSCLQNGQLTFQRLFSDQNCLKTLKSQNRESFYVETSWQIYLWHVSGSQYGFSMDTTFSHNPTSTYTLLQKKCTLILPSSPSDPKVTDPDLGSCLFWTELHIIKKLKIPHLSLLWSLTPETPETSETPETWDTWDIWDAWDTWDLWDAWDLRDTWESLRHLRPLRQKAVRWICMLLLGKSVYGYELHKKLEVLFIFRFIFIINYYKITIYQFMKCFDIRTWLNRLG